MSLTNTRGSFSRWLEGQLPRSLNSQHSRQLSGKTRVNLGAVL